MKAYQIKIELTGSDPLIWRRLIIPADVLFYRLHQAVQHAMGWHGSTLNMYYSYEFDLPEACLRLTNDEEALEENKRTIDYYKSTRSRKVLDPFGVIARQLKMRVQNPRRVKIGPLIENNRHMKYTYHFGFPWIHQIHLEAVIDDCSIDYPMLVDGAGDCPPELVGDVDAYSEFLQIYHDPRHPDHQQAVDWADAQDYRVFEIADANAILKMQKW